MHYKRVKDNSRSEKSKVFFIAPLLNKPKSRAGVWERAAGTVFYRASFGINIIEYCE